jgi:hypothetical protein
MRLEYWGLVAVVASGVHIAPILGVFNDKVAKLLLANEGSSLSTAATATEDWEAGWV